MDLDAFTAANRPQWDRLAALAKRRQLNGAEADELVRLYQTVATHLSTVQSVAPDPATITRLSDLLGRARAKIAGAHEPNWQVVSRFFALDLPAALYRLRWWALGTIAATFAIALCSALWVSTPEGLNAMGPPSVREEYVNKLFTQYYENTPAMALGVWTNNAWVCAQAIALGITGIGVAYVMFSNAVSLGATAGMMGAYGKLDVFFLWIAPHGLLELSCVFVAGAAGLKIFWTIIDPGPRTRGRALAEEGRSLFTVTLGLAIALAVSGLVEGLVTGSALPWPVKIVIGAVVCAAFWVYVLWIGRRAARAGMTGDITAEDAGDVLPVAA